MASAHRDELPNRVGIASLVPSGELSLFLQLRRAGSPSRTQPGTRSGCDPGRCTPTGDSSAAMGQARHLPYAAQGLSGKQEYNILRLNNCTEQGC